jgi:NAD(P)H-hydrate epimerase
MSGAATMAGLGALRSGAGLVTLAIPRCIWQVVASAEPSFMTAPLRQDPQGHISPQSYERIGQLARSATCMAVGPGLGRSTGLDELVPAIYRNLTIPMVVDADGLNALADDRTGCASPGGPRILTPHPGEFRRLTRSADTDRTALVQMAESLAAQHQVVVVLKGHRSVITDGRRTVTNATGNPGMATGGAGDVLTGVITALVCQNLTPFDAAYLGCHLHGLAGDLAACQLGFHSLIATDLVEWLPAAFTDYARRQGEVDP